MKNYTLNKEEEKNFILNYYFYGNRIVIQWATGEKTFKDYTIAEEKRILKKMRYQVLHSEEYEKRTRKKRRKYQILLGFFATIMMIDVIGMIGLGLLVPIASDAQVFALFFGFLVGGCDVFAIEWNAQKLHRYQKRLQDLKKNKLFVENELLFQRKIMGNCEALENVSPKSRHVISSTLNANKDITLRTIDAVSYRDVRKLLDTVSEDREYPIVNQYPTVKRQKSRILSKRQGIY